VGEVCEKTSRVEVVASIEMEALIEHREENLLNDEPSEDREDREENTEQRDILLYFSLST
jgi:hypothetical protein